ncbi:MAG: hypothetical protein EA376_12450 [Phycisphaeraceae bacterium]|nr:MAG: hypothetical protein EA376_12450 [Phycisphaeraceae bacterium]
MPNAPDSLSPAVRRPLVGPAITFGFATALAMWTVGYALHIPEDPAIPGPVIAAALVALLLVGGVCIGRWVPRADALTIGLGAGLVTSLINLMILGSILSAEDDPEAGLRSNAAMWVAGWIVFGTALMCISAVATSRITGGLPESRRADADRWLARFGIVAAVSVLLILPVGGIVTSTETGMAVPDWPTSEGFNMFLYPLSRMTGGLLYEHAHRLFGALVGLTTMTLMIYALAVDRRRWLKGAVVGAFVLVVIQGIMGGYRVEWDNTALRIVHGFTAQIFFAFMCAIAAFLSLTWRSDKPAASTRAAGAIRGFAWALVAAMALQILIGATGRHMGQHLHALLSHAVFSIVPLVLAIGVGVRLKTAYRDIPHLRIVGAGLMHGVGLQMVLGGLALWIVLTHRGEYPLIRVAMATSHQVLGAILFGLSALAVAWTHRLLTREARAEGA